MKQFLKRYWPQLVIFVIVAVIASLNYKPGTFLSGWDTLHPEFDFGLNFQRLINGVWSRGQGLGAIPGHSQMADLPRVIILWVAHFMLPVNMLRYFYIFLCLLLGPLGMYNLIKSALGVGGGQGEGTRGHSDSNLDLGYYGKKPPVIPHAIQLISLLTAFFYLFNLSTVQQFYVPFEMFPTQYALLPWIIYYALKYLQGGSSSKYLLLFSLFTLFSTPQAYAAQLWYAFFATFVLFLITYCLLKPSGSSPPLKRTTNVKRTIILIVITLAINSFWLLPNIYYILTSSSTPREAKQNRIFSQEYRLRNQENGYLRDVALAKGFYFNWTIYNFQKNRYEYLMHDWRTHLKNPLVAAIGYLLFVAVILGVILSFLRKNKLFISFFPFFSIPFILLMNHTFPFEQLFNLLSSFALSEEALRFVFTKFSILLIFGYAFYSAFFLLFLFEQISSRKTLYFISAICVLALVFFTLPIFKGQLIAEKVRIKIPNEYFQLYELMKRQPEGVVLSLPLYNFAGWSYYDWGYQGSGFIWFGLKQPILDRDSDRWSVANEQAFREFHFAVYSRNSQSLENDLKKYNVQYLLWDKSVITYSEKNRQQIIYQREIQTLIENLQKQGKIEKMAQFGNIQVFKTSEGKAQSQIIDINYNFEPYRWGFNDFGYQDYGDYVGDSSNQKLIKITYPYRSMIEVSDRVKKMVFDRFQESASNEGSLILTATVLYSLNQNRQQVELKTDGTEDTVYFKTKDLQVGMHLDLSSLKHDHGYFLVFKSKNIEGMPLRICLFNLYSDLCDLYDELSKNKTLADDYFYIPPSENSLGFGLSIDNISYGDYNAINELAQLKIVSIPQDLTAEKAVLPLPSPPSSFGKYFVLRQSYHPGWIAYQDGKKLKNHVLVNNWANGWELEGEGAVTVVFWPQYLEFVGFGLLVISFLLIIMMRSKLL